MPDYKDLYMEDNDELVYLAKIIKDNLRRLQWGLIKVQKKYVQRIGQGSEDRWRFWTAKEAQVNLQSSVLLYLPVQCTVVN